MRALLPRDASFGGDHPYIDFCRPGAPVLGGLRGRGVEEGGGKRGRPVAAKNTHTVLTPRNPSFAPISSHSISHGEGGALWLKMGLWVG